MAKYQKYIEYKDSGVEWLGKIPRDWSILKLKFAVELISEKSQEVNQKYVGMENIASKNGKYIQTEEVIPEGISNTFKVSDVLFGKLRPYLAKSWLADFCGICSSELLVLRAKNVAPKFLQYYTLTDEFINQVDSSTYGSKMPRASWDFIGLLPIPICSFELSTKIANFLNHETAKIDTLIAKQEKLIELLKEKRQAVISHAVTKGLNPNAPMKDSGVEWLGEVPEYWEVRQLRYLGSCQNGINIGAEYFGSGSSFISYGDVYRNPELPRVFDGLVQSTENDKRIYSVHRGDVLFTRTSETIEEIGFSSTCLTDVKDATFAGFLIRFRPIQNTLLPEYSKFYFRNILLRAFFVKEMNLVTRASLSQELLKKLAVPFPSLEEQKQIADYLSAKERVFDKLVNDCIKQIELLKERRTALISAAVTGKIDVRNWQNPNKNNNQNNMELSA